MLIKNFKNYKNFVLFFLFFTFQSKFIIGNLKSEDNSYIMNGPLAGSLYYTSEKPGRWKNLTSSHKPIILKKNDTIEITTNHEMRGFEHYIIKHVVFDKEFNIISEKKFDPSKSIAKSIHNIRGYSEKIYVLSVCNLHDSWLSSISINK